MKKLLSIILSVSILMSSVTPSFSGVKVKRVPRSVARRSVGLNTRVTSKVLRTLPRPRVVLQKRILTGQTSGLANHILTGPVLDRASLMRREFVSLSLIPDAVSPAQRATAGSFYSSHLKDIRAISEVSQTQFENFLSSGNRQQIAQQAIQQAQHALADASALGLVGTRAQAPVLLDFYKQAQGTVFADTATLITARGLLRMQAYEELGKLLRDNAENPVLSGMAQYIKGHELPVEVPATLQGRTARAVDPAWVSFLEEDCPLNAIHADASLQATERWMNLGEQEARAALPKQESAPVALQAATPAASAAKTSLAQGTQEATGASVSQQTTEIPSLVREDTPLAQGTQGAVAQQAPRPATPAQPTVARQKPSNSRVLYSGFPVFAFIDSAGKLIKRVRERFGKKKSESAPYEEPGLHDNNVNPIYQRTEETVLAEVGEDYEIVGKEEGFVTVGAEGFQFTVEDADKVEHILHHVDLTISSTLKNFSAEYNRLALDNAHVFELRNQTLPSKRPDHFYFVLSNANGEFGVLLDGISELGLSRPLRIKIQQSASPRKTVSLPIYKKGEGGNVTEIFAIAEVDLKLLNMKSAQAEKGMLVVDGETIYFFDKETGEKKILENAFIRLPKEESQHWAKILAAHPQTHFSLGVFATKDKMPPLTYMVPCIQPGLGKTVSPVLHEMSTLGETESTYVMMGINNVLPALMGVIHPLLKRFGEVRVYRFGVASLAAGGIVALLSGLSGHVGGEVMSTAQLSAFLASSTLIALGTSITRYVQNLLIYANRGIIPPVKASKAAKAGLEATAPLNAKHLVKRTKEIFTKKDGKSLKDVILLQKAAMFKNLGTAVFLSFPWIANAIGKHAFGVDLGLDFSASYVPYTAFSLLTLYKVHKIPYRDSFPLNVTLLHNKLIDLHGKVLPKVSQIKPQDLPKASQPQRAPAATMPRLLPPTPGSFVQPMHLAATPERAQRAAEALRKKNTVHTAPVELEGITAEHPQVQEIAKQVKESISSLVSVEARKSKKSPKSLTRKYEAEFTDAVEQHLLKEGRTPEEARAFRAIFQQAFDELEHRNVKLIDVIGMAGLPASLTAMWLATLGELGFSNNFAFAMRELIGNATAATGIVGLLLYGFMFGWRVWGNFLSQRMSGGSMYALSSLTAVLGPLAMAFSHGNLPALVAGAIISCFGVSNYFAQMYDYIIKLHPQYKREVALLINYTMPLAALCAPLLRLAGDVPGLDMMLVSGAMAGSVALTPAMLANSSVIRVAQNGFKNMTSRIKKFFRRGGNGNEPPLIENPAQ